MLVLTIITTLVGFGLGALRDPPLRTDPRSRAGAVTIGLVVCALLGAACGLACLYTYLAIHELVNAPALNAGFARSAGGLRASSPDANIFVGAVYSIASESGVLLALAAGVFMLAPAHRDSAR